MALRRELAGAVGPAFETPAGERKLRVRRRRQEPWRPRRGLRRRRGRERAAPPRLVARDQIVLVILELDGVGVQLDVLLVVVGAVRRALVLCGLGAGAGRGAALRRRAGRAVVGGRTVKVVGVVAAVGLRLFLDLGDAVRDCFRGDVWRSRSDADE